MVNISKQDNTIVFSFTNSDFYLYGTGTVEVPMNSLSLYVDESDMITYKKAQSNDVFISVPIDETNFANKAAAITFYKENMVGAVGGGSDPNAFVSADYDSETERINFYNAEQEIVDYIDASAFVIDGMIENVYVDNGYLIIDFNTASGQQDIYIPLTDIFPSDDYYDKNEVDLLLAEKQDISGLSSVTLSTFVNDEGYITQPEVIAYKELPNDWDVSNSMADLISDINDDSDAVVGKVYMGTVHLNDLPHSMVQAEMKIEIISEDEGLGKVVLFTFTSSNQSPYHWEYTSAYGQTGQWREWLVQSDLTAITSALSTLSGKVDTNEEVTARALNELNTNKQDVLTAGSGITIVGNVISSTGGGGEIPTNISYFTNDVGYVTSATTDAISATIEQNERITAAALCDLNERKIDTSAVTDYSTEIAQIQSAISAINSSITAINQTIDTKEEVISIALNSLNTRLGGLTLVKISQTDYDNLLVKDVNTLYVVIPD